MQFSAALVTAFLAATATALPVAGDDGATTAPARRYRPMPIVNHRPSDRRSPGMHIIDKIPVPEKRDGEDAGNEGDDEEASVERRYRPMPIVNHRPSDRRSPGMHIIDKIPVPEKRGGDDGGDDDGGDDDGGDDDDGAVERRYRPMPIVNHRPSDRRGEPATEKSAIANSFWGMPIIDHRPSDRRRAEAETAAAPEEKSAGSAIAKAFWGMPIINHTPYPGRRRRAE